MLTTLQVRNYAVVAATSLELSGGMTVLSGETGAGKSIIVGALGLVLGDRADAGIVRDGTDQAEVSAHFDASEPVQQWLVDEGLDAEGECLIRRLVSREGRSRAWVNGHAVTLQSLRELGARLVDIHGQHAHQSLTKKANQRAIIDSFAGNESALRKLRELHRGWRSAADELASLEAAAAERDGRLDLVRFQLQELQALAPVPGEAGELESERKLLAHAGGLAEGVAATLSSLSDDDDLGAQPVLARAAQRLQALAEIDQRLDPAARLLAEAEIQTSEAVNELAGYADQLDLDPQRRDYVEQRLASLQTLARKHRVEADELAQRLDELEAELHGLDHSAERRELLLQRVDEARKAYDAQALKLHRKRVKAAGKLDQAISAELRQLGMQEAQFRTRIDRNDSEPTTHGIDSVEFQVAANAGQAPRPLSRVASGGELSRIALAVEMLAARHQPVPTMVFDEVDTGVGGGIAEVVGRKLRLLGEAAQVICVTHLAQVASQAHQHVRVSKHSDGAQTETSLEPLDARQRTEEIARMLGGIEITSATRKHAREMLERAGA